MMKYLREHIFLKALLTLLIVFVTIFSFFSLVLSRIVYTTLQKELTLRILMIKENMIEKNASNVKNLGKNTEDAIAVFEFYNLSDILEKAVSKDVDIRYAIISDRSGVIHMDTENKNILNE